MSIKKLLFSLQNLNFLWALWVQATLSFSRWEMDMDFWAARIQRQIPVMNSSRGRNSVGVEDEVRAWFPCPFCYIEIELQLFHLHLQEEHYFDLKNAVCPICAANLGKDPLAHFTIQHAHSIKRRKASQKSGVWNNINNTDIVKDLKELSSLIDVVTGTGTGTVIIPNPFISKDVQQDRDSSHIAATTCVQRTKTDSLKEDDREELRQRTAFLHELLFSTIFST